MMSPERMAAEPESGLYYGAGRAVDPLKADNTI